MKSTKALLAILAGASTLVAASAALASTGSWSNSVAAPVMNHTQTNVASATMNPGATPSGAKISSTVFHSNYATTSAINGKTNVHGIFSIWHCETLAPFSCSIHTGFNSGTDSTSWVTGGVADNAQLPFAFHVEYLNSDGTTTQYGMTPQTSTALNLTVNYSY